MQVLRVVYVVGLNSFMNRCGGQCCAWARSEQNFFRWQQATWGWGCQLCCCFSLENPVLRGFYRAEAMVCVCRYVMIDSYIPLWIASRCLNVWLVNIFQVAKQNILRNLKHYLVFRSPWKTGSGSISLVCYCLLGDDRWVCWGADGRTLRSLSFLLIE